MTLYREIGGLDRLVIVGPGVTPGMVQVARLDEDWRNHPELCWQAWPDDLEPCEELRKAA